MGAPLPPDVGPGTSAADEHNILESIRAGTAASHVKRQASRGTLPVSAHEMMEILVLLAGDADFTCAEPAQQNLAAIPPDKLLAQLNEPSTTPEALAYFGAKPDASPEIIAAVAKHPCANDAALSAIAARMPLDPLPSVLADENRLEELPDFVAKMLTRADLPAEAKARLDKIQALFQRQQAEMAALLAKEAEEEAKAPPVEGKKRESLTERVSRMGVSERVQCAMKGNREERLMLIRDPTKVVWRSVINSPKASPAEIENFATMKNIAGEALRQIATNRKYIKDYIVVRNLCANPRSPLEVTLPLLNRLTLKDLKDLTNNRNIPEPIRTSATKMFKQKTETKKSAVSPH